MGLMTSSLIPTYNKFTQILIKAAGRLFWKYRQSYFVSKMIYIQLGFCYSCKKNYKTAFRNLRIVWVEVTTTLDSKRYPHNSAVLEIKPTLRTKASAVCNYCLLEFHFIRFYHNMYRCFILLLMLHSILSLSHPNFSLEYIIIELKYYYIQQRLKIEYYRMFW